MPKRIPLSAIGVSREINGKNVTVYPEIGKVFDFTADELTELKAIEKASASQLVRQPTNEDPDGQGSVNLDNGSNTVVGLDKLTKAQLVEYASQHQIDLTGATSNEAIREAIKAEEAKRATDAGEEDL
jgi:L-ribulose-5-phosphate 3-epimerase UlaE